MAEVTETKTIKSEDVGTLAKENPDLFGTRVTPLSANRIQVIASDDECRLVFGSGIGSDPKNGIAHTVIVLTAKGLDALAKALNDTIATRAAAKKAAQDSNK